MMHMLLMVVTTPGLGCLHVDSSWPEAHPDSATAQMAARTMGRMSAMEVLLICRRLGAPSDARFGRARSGLPGQHGRLDPARILVGKPEERLVERAEVALLLPDEPG